MKVLLIISTFFLMSMVIILCACSGISGNGQSLIAPSVDVMPCIIDNLPEASIDNHNRTTMAVYEAVIDPKAETFTITPVTRDAKYHFPLTQLYPNCLQITGFGFTPNFWADIKLAHPLPGSGIDAFDPRVIAIIPTHWGAYFHYPSLGVYGNPKILLEPDGYTRLFNELAPDIFGNVNPFVAYSKDQFFRRWSSTGQTEETKRWKMDLDGFGGDFRFMLVVDVSTNYPNPPTPITDNAPEPIAISASVTSGLNEHGGSAEITVTLLDWQGIRTTGAVKVEAPDLFDGTLSLEYSESSNYPDEYIYTGTISNENHAPEGYHTYLVAASDLNTGIHTYKEFTLHVRSCGGNLNWAKRAGGVYNDYGNGITTLSDDSTVVTGSFTGTATFGSSEPNQTILTSAGSVDIFIANYNPDGTLAWAKQAGGTRVEVGRGITSLSDDSTVVTGYFSGDATFGLGETNETVLTSVGDYDAFIARYNPDGTLMWAKSAGGTYDDYGHGITTLSDDSTVVTGYFEDEATFGQGEPNQITLTSAGSFDIFIASYKPDGTLAWAKHAGGSGSNYGIAITTLLDDSTVVTGAFEGTVTFGEGELNETILTSPGYRDIFIARYKPDGALAWAKRAGGLYRNMGYGITALQYNSTVVTGYFEGTATFGQGELNETILISAGDRDLFIARYKPDGALAWAKRAGGADRICGLGIASFSDDSTVVTGYFEGTAIFGQDEPNETILTSAERRDIFIARCKPDGSFLWAKSARGSASDYGYGITSLSDDSSVITGYFRETATFGEGELNEIILTSAGDYDIFIARFEP